MNPKDIAGEMRQYGITNYPFVLDPDNPANAATTGDNVRDNVEQVYISSPSNGTYTVIVTHKGVLSNGVQDVSIILSGINTPASPTFAITDTGVQSGAGSFEWSGVQDIDIGAQSSTGRGTVNFDFNGASASEYIIEYGPDGLLMLPQNGNEMIMFDEIPFSPLVFLTCKRLAEGELIDANLTDPLLWKSEDDLLVQSLGGVSGGIAGYWKGADHEYMGVRFADDDGIHYGWIEMSVSDTLELATIHSWEYNTVPGEGLVAGVVPEPSTIALFLVGVITFGIKRLKWHT